MSPIGGGGRCRHALIAAPYRFFVPLLDRRTSVPKLARSPRLTRSSRTRRVDGWPLRDGPDAGHVTTPTAPRTSSPSPRPGCDRWPGSVESFPCWRSSLPAEFPSSCSLLTAGGPGFCCTEPSPSSSFSPSPTSSSAAGRSNALGRRWLPVVDPGHQAEAGTHDPAFEPDCLEANGTNQRAQRASGEGFPSPGRPPVGPCSTILPPRRAARWPGASLPTWRLVANAGSRLLHEVVERKEPGLTRKSGPLGGSA